MTDQNIRLLKTTRVFGDVKRYLAAAISTIQSLENQNDKRSKVILSVPRRYEEDAAELVWTHAPSLVRDGRFDIHRLNTDHFKAFVDNANAGYQSIENILLNGKKDGDYLNLFDLDDWQPPDHDEGIINALQDRPNAAAIVIDRRVYNIGTMPQNGVPVLSSRMQNGETLSSHYTTDVGFVAFCNTTLNLKSPHITLKTIELLQKIPLELGSVLDKCLAFNLQAQGAEIKFVDEVASTVEGKIELYIGYLNHEFNLLGDGQNSLKTDLLFQKCFYESMAELCNLNDKQAAFVNNRRQTFQYLVSIMDVKNPEHILFDAYKKLSEGHIRDLKESWKSPLWFEQALPISRVELLQAYRLGKADNYYDIVSNGPMMRAVA